MTVLNVSALVAVGAAALISCPVRKNRDDKRVARRLDYSGMRERRDED